MNKTPANSRRATLITLAINLGAPLALFYGLRAAGTDQWLALTLSALPPGARATQTMIARRQIDALALLTLSSLVLSIAVSFLSGSPRFLLAKDGWLTAVGGVWMLATLPRTPFYFRALRSLTTGARRERAEIAWRESPAFRHMLRVATAIWGTGLILEAAVRVVLAYSLPVDQVPLISALQYAAAFLALGVSGHLYLRHAGIRPYLGPRTRPNRGSRARTP